VSADVVQPKAQAKPAGMINLLNKYFQATGFKRGFWPKGIPTGVLPGAIGQSALGAGMGSMVAAPLLNALFPNRFDPRRLRIGLGLGGALLGGLAAWPAISSARKHKEPLYSTTGDAYPFTKAPAAPAVKAQVTTTQEKEGGFGALPSLPSGNMPPIGIAQAQGTIYADPAMSVSEKVRTLGYMSRATHGQDSGLLSNPGRKLFGGMLGAGLGYGAAAMGSKVMGAVFGLRPQAQSTLSRIGAVAGLLRGAGVI